MGFKAVSSLLLLLLVSVQAFATDCDVRCATMMGSSSASHHSAGGISGMDDCHGMASASNHQVAATLITSESCASRICKNDWTFLQSPVASELGASPLPMTELRQVSASTGATISLLFETGPATNITPLFDPLIVSLRV